MAGPHFCYLALALVPNSPPRKLHLPIKQATPQSIPPPRPPRRSPPSPAAATAAAPRPLQLQPCQRPSHCLRRRIMGHSSTCGASPSSSTRRSCWSAGHATPSGPSSPCSGERPPARRPSGAARRICAARPAFRAPLICMQDGPPLTTTSSPSRELGQWSRSFVARPPAHCRGAARPVLPSQAAAQPPDQPLAY